MIKATHEESQKLPLHVAFFTGYIPPYQLPVFHELDRRIEKLTVLLSTPMEGNRDWQPEWSGLDVRVQKTVTKLSKWKHRIGFSDSKETHFPLDTLKQLRALNPDVIVSEELGFRSLLCSFYQLFHRRKPLVLVCNLSEHTEQGRGYLRSIVRKWLAKRATITTANGVSGLRYLRQVGFPERTLHLYPYVSRPGLLERLPLSRDHETSRNLVYVGDLSDRKGILEFLEQLAVWCRSNAGQNVNLRLVGKGDLETAIQRMETPVNLTVELLGFRGYDDIAKILGRSDVFVFPTLADEWGLVVNEALMAGLPVFGSKYSQAVEELIVENSNGWVFDPTDQSDTFRALSAMLATSSQQLDTMRSPCRASVIERTPAWAACRFVKALQAAIASPSENGRLNA